jgi:hypothetical protein
VTTAFENLENYWNAANVKNFAYLPYNGKDDDGNPIPPPQRSPPPEMAQAYVQGMTLARQDLMDVTGQFQAELGMPSNERSGKAIDARQRQGDNATYHYIDNQAKGIRQIGRILIDLIPKVYNTTRVIRILAEDGSDSQVILTQGAPAAHQRVRLTPQGPQPIGPDQAESTMSSPMWGRHTVRSGRRQRMRLPRSWPTTRRRSRWSATSGRSTRTFQGRTSWRSG